MFFYIYGTTIVKKGLQRELTHMSSQSRNLHSVHCLESIDKILDQLNCFCFPDNRSTNYDSWRCCDRRSKHNNSNCSPVFTTIESCNQSSTVAGYCSFSPEIHRTYFLFMERLLENLPSLSNPNLKVATRFWRRRSRESSVDCRPMRILTKIRAPEIKTRSSIVPLPQVICSRRHRPRAWKRWEWRSSFNAPTSWGSWRFENFFTGVKIKISVRYTTWGTTRTRSLSWSAIRWTLISLNKTIISHHNNNNQKQHHQP